MSLRNSLISMAINGETCGIPILDAAIADAREEKRMVTECELADLVAATTVSKPLTDEEFKQKLDAEFDNIVSHGVELADAEYNNVLEFTPRDTSTEDKEAA